MNAREIMMDLMSGSPMDLVKVILNGRELDILSMEYDEEEHAWHITTREDAQ